jgi:hypothetical protein
MGEGPTRKEQKKRKASPVPRLFLLINFALDQGLDPHLSPFLQLHYSLSEQRLFC